MERAVLRAIASILFIIPSCVLRVVVIGVFYKYGRGYGFGYFIYGGCGPCLHFLRLRIDILEVVGENFRRFAAAGASARIIYVCARKLSRKGWGAALECIATYKS